MVSTHAHDARKLHAMDEIDDFLSTHTRQLQAIDYFDGATYDENNRLNLQWSIANYYFFNLRIKYNKEVDRIEMILFMPDNMYFSIGFGPSMTATDMITWHAKGE